MTFLAGFSKRKAIKIATAGIPSSDLAAFSKLFKISGDTDIGGETTSQKLAVTLADGVTQVPYGALSFGVSGGAATAVLRAKFDLSHSWSNGDTIGYLYYDHTATDQSNKSGVFGSSFKGYWPLEEDPSGSAPQMKDWTTNANDGTTQGSMASGDLVAGQVGNGLSLNGSTKYVDCGTGSSLSITGAISLGLNVKFNSVAGNQELISKDADTGGRAYALDYSGTPRFYLNGSGNGMVIGNALSTATWYRIVGVFNPSTLIAIYVNGVDVSSVLGAAGASIPTATTSVQIGHRSYAGNEDFLNGIADESFIYSGVLSPTWIAYDYTDQSSNSSTFTLGAEETASSGGASIIGDNFLLDGARLFNGRIAA